MHRDRTQPCWFGPGVGLVRVLVWSRVSVKVSVRVGRPTTDAVAGRPSGRETTREREEEEEEEDGAGVQQRGGSWEIGNPSTIRPIPSNRYTTIRSPAAPEGPGGPEVKQKAQAGTGTGRREDG